MYSGYYSSYDVASYIPKRPKSDWFIEKNRRDKDGFAVIRLADTFICARHELSIVTDVHNPTKIFSVQMDSPYCDEWDPDEPFERLIVHLRSSSIVAIIDKLIEPGNPDPDYIKRYRYQIELRKITKSAVIQFVELVDEQFNLGDDNIDNIHFFLNNQAPKKKEEVKETPKPLEKLVKKFEKIERRKLDLNSIIERLNQLKIFSGLDIQRDKITASLVSIQKQKVIKIDFSKDVYQYIIELKVNGLKRMNLECELTHDGRAILIKHSFADLDKWWFKNRLPVLREESINKYYPLFRLRAKLQLLGFFEAFDEKEIGVSQQDKIIMTVPTYGIDVEQHVFQLQQIGINCNTKIEGDSVLSKRNAFIINHSPEDLEKILDAEIEKKLALNEAALAVSAKNEPEKLNENKSDISVSKEYSKSVEPKQPSLYSTKNKQLLFEKNGFYSPSKFATKRFPYGPYSDHCCYPNDPLVQEGLKLSK